MSEENNRSNQPPAARGTFIERLVRKTLSSVGGIFEKPFQKTDENERLPQTSDLTERLKRLIDAGVRENEDGSRIAPHLIHLKYTWGASQTDEFESNLARLKNELLLVAIDHINDYRYRTVAPVKLEIKPDILTEGITLAVGFDADSIAHSEKVEVPVEIFAGLLPPEENKPEPPPKPAEIEVKVSLDIPNADRRDVKLRFIPNGKTNLTIGRNREMDLFLDHPSVSKLHASIVMNGEGKLRVADVGSTNGTSLDGERISYGKAYEIKPENTIRFGEVNCRFDWDWSEFAAQAKADLQTNESATTDGDVRINVDSRESDEPETVFSAETETLVGKTADEPETVLKSSDEPETIFRHRTNKSNEEDSDPTMDFSEQKSDDETKDSSNRTNE